MVEDTATRADNPVEIGQDKQARFHGNNKEFFLTTSEPPPKTPETKKDPQDRSGDLKIMSISDMAENPAQANNQGLGIHIVDLKTQ